MQTEYQNKTFLRELLARDALSWREWRQLGGLYDRVIGRILTDHHKAQSSVTVVFCNDEFIRNMNREYRGINAPTDVLSFGLEEEGSLGEIYLSAEYVLEQEPMKKRRYVHEIAYLVIHGVLHMLGYVHDTSEQRVRMEDIQERYFQEFCEGYEYHGKTAK